MTWTLEVGDAANRTAIQTEFRGSNARGISAPGRATGLKDIMLWWRPGHGELFGYDDGWDDDRGTSFSFSGTGQRRDQTFEAPHAENGRVRDHAANGDRLRLLRYEDKKKNLVRYIGEFRLDPGDPWHFRDGLDRLGTVRQVIEFRLLPIGHALFDSADVRHHSLRTSVARAPLPARPGARRTAIEPLNDAMLRRVVAAQTQSVQRLELILVHDFGDWLAAGGVETCGLDIPYAPERRTLRADLFVPAPDVLIEAKASTAREHIRMAIGQLLDYARFVDPRPSLCVLTPDRPPDDMLALLDTLSIDAVWRDRASGFAGTCPWLPIDGAAHSRDGWRVIGLPPGDGW